MIAREKAFSMIASCITDELVVTGIASQTSSWFKAKDSDQNLYLRGPMGLAPAVGFGVALAHPDRKVVVIEGDGSLLMGLTSLVSIADYQPRNLTLICVDNQIYEAGGEGTTTNASRTDFVKTVKGIGIALANTNGDPETLQESVRKMMEADECSFLHIPIGRREGPFSPPMLKPFEMKYRFGRYLKESDKSPE